MKPGFSKIMSAQFFSSLADNALFVVAVEMLRTGGAHPWQSAALVPMFALFYVLLAPFVGAFADAYPKGRVMFMSNAIKVVGCVMMMYGSHPLLSYALVGLGAAVYSPAKYGILTELLPPSLLVKANGWMEGLTITSIILGVVLGGVLVSESLYLWMLDWHLPGFSMLLHDRIQMALGLIVLVYGLAAAINVFIPRTNVPTRPMWRNKNLGPLGCLQVLTRDFWRSNRRLWRDRLGQISLATTTLFWGASGNLRYLVLAWSAAVLGLGTSQSSALLGVVAIGTAIGAVVSAMRIRLDQATRVLPLGILMGVVVVVMHWVNHIVLVVPILVFVGFLGGYLVVPMNALLQHRGHSLMGAGRSIAVQNFNEQLCIVLLGLLYVLATTLGLSARGAMTSFGIMVMAVMLLIAFWNRHNMRHHHEAIEHEHHLIRLDHHRQR